MKGPSLYSIFFDNTEAQTQTKICRIIENPQCYQTVQFVFAKCLFRVLKQPEIPCSACAFKEYTKRYIVNRKCLPKTNNQILRSAKFSIELSMIMRKTVRKIVVPEIL